MSKLSSTMKRLRAGRYWLWQQSMLVAIGLFSSLAEIGYASDPSDHASDPKERAFFENKIRPVLVKQCYSCHSADAENVGGGLLLDTRAGVLKGGQSGPLIVVGKPDESLLIQALRHEHVEMPPENPLPEAVVNDFVTWVRRGAVDPRAEQTDAPSSNRFDRDAVWSFKPRQLVATPDVTTVDWPRDRIDSLTLAKMESAGLRPSHDAPPETLIRRLHFDLIGIPPTAEQIAAYVADFTRDGQSATARLVDSLLENPHFGERWGRHWLDVARFGESNGNDGLGRNATFPHAWRYRDYVIDAFNQDIPYDQFLTEQIAGDLLPAVDAAQRNRQLIATGFLAIGSKPASAMNNNFAMDIVDDQINAVCTAVLGLSVACARCHDHKHDPITTADYYALAGIFTSTETLYGLAAKEKLTAPPTPLHSLVSVWNPVAADDPAKQKTPQFPDNYAQAIADLQPKLHWHLDTAPDGVSPAGATFSTDHFAQVKTANFQGALDSADSPYSVAFWFKNDLTNAERPITAYLFSRAELGNKDLPGDHLGIGGNHDPERSGKLFVFNGNAKKKTVAGSTVIAPQSWNHVVLVRDAKRVKLFLNGELEIDATLEATFAQSVDFCLGIRSDQFAPLEGNLAQFAIFQRALTNDQARQLHDASGQPRPARTVGFAMGVRDKSAPADCKIHIGGETSKQGDVVPRGWLGKLVTESSTSGRRELAAWLTAPDHPQTARVMVNRIWIQLMGQGIVSTPEDFGIYGARPSHPELLDHLAQRYVENGWSTKQLIRCIVLARTYQLDSHADPAMVAADPDNQWFARHSLRRRDAESLRDSMLHASGELQRSPAQGSAIDTLDALINWPSGNATDLHRPSNHRSVYLCYLRHSPPRELAAFDLPDGIGVASQRDITTLPTQSLYLLNNPFVIAQSQSLAERVLVDHDGAAAVREMFRRTLQRDPTEIETKRSLSLVAMMASDNAASGLLPEAGQLKAWASLGQALFATNEFRYID